MPLVLKLIYLYAVYVTYVSVVIVIQNKPVNFELFNSGFPRNYPILWNLFNAFMMFVELYVLMNRSYSMMSKYVYFAFTLYVILLVNGILSTWSVGSRELLLNILVFGLVFVINGFIILYPLKQTKYYNQP